MEPIGRRIYELRIKLGFSQEGLADRVGVTRQTIHNWEMDTMLPNKNNAVALCKALSIDIETLYGLPSQAKEEAATTEAVIKKRKEKRRRRLRRAIIAFIVIFTLSFIVLTLITIFLGMIVFDKVMSSDYATSSFDFHTKLFYIFLIASFVVLVLDIILILLLRSKKFHISNQVYDKKENENQTV